MNIRIVLRGGRGASSFELGKQGFSNAAGGSGQLSFPKYKYPAEFNRQGRFSSVNGAIALFANKYKDDKIEYGISVDPQGFTHRHVSGDKSSVSITPAGKGHTLVHNHPSGSSFSMADLQVFSGTREVQSIIAVGKANTYAIRKKKGFDSREFEKALKSARFPKGMNYNEGADWWLRNNAKKYGYEYSKRKTSNVDNLFNQKEKDQRKIQNKINKRRNR